MHDISSSPVKPVPHEAKALSCPQPLRHGDDTSRVPYPRLTPLLREQLEPGHNSEEVERFCMKYTKNSQPDNDI